MKSIEIECGGVDEQYALSAFAALIILFLFLTSFEIFCI